MRYRRIAAGAAALATALASAAAAQTPTVPPEVLAPVDGAATPAGAPVTFRVRTFPGDAYLWVLFSRSPLPAEACGTIGRDLGLADLEPTADPSVYEATPTVYDTYTFWLNRPGTYYWQAYRIHHGDGADGCVEAAPRALQVTGVRPVEVGPQPVSPTDGQVVPPGPLTFRATGMPGDDGLWVHVSRSPEPVDAGGLIGDDVELERMLPTGEPGVFAAAPTYRDGATFWMNRPGTYYWQPYRISYDGDPDGRVEGPVRRLVIRTPPSLALSAARLAGDFRALERVTATRGFSTRVGRTNRSTWTFTPTCRTGPCGARLTLYTGILGTRRRQIPLVRRGAAYRGSGRFAVATCGSAPVIGRMSVTVRVTRGAWVTGTWRATRIAGGFRTAAPGTVRGRVRCPAGYVQSSVTATLAGP